MESPAKYEAPPLYPNPRQKVTLNDVEIMVTLVNTLMMTGTYSSTSEVVDEAIAIREEIITKLGAKNEQP